VECNYRSNRFAGLFLRNPIAKYRMGIAKMFTKMINAFANAQTLHLTLSFLGGQLIMFKGANIAEG
jgi:hypothetical protein